MSDWVRVARAEEVQTETPLAVSLDDDAVVLARLGDDIFALEDLCTHDGSDISGGCIVEQRYLGRLYRGGRYRMPPPRRPFLPSYGRSAFAPCI